MSAVHDGYCLICQEAHTFRQDCLKSVVCKGCGQTGHLKIHCFVRDGQERYNIPFWERKSRKRKRKGSVERSSSVDHSQNVDLEESKLGGEADLSTVSPPRKRRKISMISSNFKKNVSTEVCEASPISMFMKVTDRKVSDDRIGANCNFDSKVNAYKYESINSSREKGPAIYQETAPSKKTSLSNQQFSAAEIKFQTLTSESTPVWEKQCSQTLSSSLNYQVVCVHIETFKRSFSSLTKLTQIGCSSVWFLERTGNHVKDDFFRAIKPSGLETILDDYTIGGDLLQALHMTREEDGTFQFRGRFEEQDPCKTVVCCSEESALGDFLAHLTSLYEMNENVVLVSVDEESLAILVEKLTALSNDEFREKVLGFTNWKRISKLLSFSSAGEEELEEFVNKRKEVQNLVRPREFLNARDVSELLRVSLMNMSQHGRQHKGKENRGKRLSSLVSSTCQRLRDLPKPKEVNTESGTEDYVEVINNFRPHVRTTMSIKLKEVIQLCSDSEEELVADRPKLITQEMKVKPKNIQSHLRKPVHNSNSPGPPSEAMIQCPCSLCKIIVKRKNIKSHLRKVHKFDLQECTEIINKMNRNKNHQISHSKSNSPIPKPNLTEMPNQVKSTKPSHSTLNNSNTNPIKGIKRKNGPISSLSKPETSGKKIKKNTHSTTSNSGPVTLLNHVTPVHSGQQDPPPTFDPVPYYAPVSGPRPQPFNYRPPGLARCGPGISSVPFNQMFCPRFPPAPPILLSMARPHLQAFRQNPIWAAEQMEIPLDVEETECVLM